MNVPSPGDPYAPPSSQPSLGKPVQPAPSDLPGPPAPADPAVAPQQPGPVPGAPYGAPPTGFEPPLRPVDGVSIAALVTGILGLTLIPVGLGIAGIVRTGAGKRRGRGLAIGGLVLGVLSTIGWSLLVAGIVAVATDSDAQRSFQEGFSDALAEQSGYDLAVGDCFDPPADLSSGDQVTPVDCALPHGSETFDVSTLDGDEYPGDTAVAGAAEAICLDAFESYVGVPYAESSLGVLYFHPTSLSWALGDRQVICGVGAYDGSPTTGSLAGSGL